MHLYYAVTVISWFCFLTGSSAEECCPAVLATRATFFVAEGRSLSLSCVVQHCGQPWTGTWVWKNTTSQTFTAVNFDRHRLTRGSVSGNQTNLDLKLLRVLRSDEGSYKCSVTWEDDDTDQGNLMYVNVTGAVPSQRVPHHRLLVCFAAFLCLPVILGLARGLSSRTKPQPRVGTRSTHTPRHRSCSHSPLPPPPLPPQRNLARQNHSRAVAALDVSEKKHEVVYTSVRLDKRSQNRVPEESTQATVYASVRFS